MSETSSKRAREEWQDAKMRKEKRRKLERREFRYQKIFYGDPLLAFQRWDHYRAGWAAEETHKSAMSWVFQELKKRTCAILVAAQRHASFQVGPPTTDKYKSAIGREDEDYQDCHKNHVRWLVMRQKEQFCKEGWGHVWSVGRKLPKVVNKEFLTARDQFIRAQKTTRSNTAPYFDKEIERKIMAVSDTD